MKIASIQFNICWEDKKKNFERASRLIERAKQDDCDCVVFPEMFNSGFSMNLDVIAEPENTQTSLFLCGLAKQYSINIIAGFAEKTDDGAENIAVFIDRQGNRNARYIKNYPYSYAGEDKLYLSGDQQVVFGFEDSKASLFICYDLRFPELFRKVAKEVDIVFVIANWPVTRQEHWETLLKARAIENQCFMVGVNRIGSDGNGLKYGGGSHVYGPSGEDLSRGGKHQEYIITQIDLAQAKRTRSDFPFLKDIKQNQ